MVEKLIRRLESVKNKNNYRKLSNYQAKIGKYIALDGIKYLNLASNDYLGISVDNEILNEFYGTFNIDINKLGFSSASSRLLAGNPEVYQELEKNLAQFFEKEKAIVFNSGYHMNTGVVPALTDKKDLILSDKLNHASIVDGILLSDAKYFRYKHLDYDELDNYLLKHRDQYENVFIITESLFSMDGDIADLKKLVNIKKKYDCFLYVDEAHSVGVYGDGKGVAFAQGVIDDIDILAGTFGKAFSSVGGFVLTNDLFYEIIVNFSRSLIFTTALPPVVVLWNLFILKNMNSFDGRRKKLFELTDYMRNYLNAVSLKTIGESYIIPYILGDTSITIQTSNFLKENKILAPAIRPPTVPEGTSRIRFSLNSQIDFEDIDNLIKILKAGVV